MHDLQRDDIARRIATRASVTAELDAPHGLDGSIDLTIATHEDGPPAHVRVAAIDALERGETHYTDRQGILPLREALAARTAAEGFPADPAGVVITNGGSEALYIILQSLVIPGDSVFVVGGTSPNVAHMIAFMGGEIVWIDGGADLPESPNARLLLVSDPSPADGTLAADGAVERLATQALERGIEVVLDRSLAWSQFTHLTPLFSDPAITEQVLTVGSFSHAWDMAGWRAGYFTTPVTHRAKMQGLKLAMSICTSTASQYAALAALEGPDDWLIARRTRMAERRDEIIALLADAGIPTTTPSAWPPLLLDTRLIQPDDEQAAAMIRDACGVIVEPASHWGPAYRGRCRLRLDASVETLREGIARLAAFHNSCG